MIIKTIKSNGFINGHKRLKRLEKIRILIGKKQYWQSTTILPEKTIWIFQAYFSPWDKNYIVYIDFTESARPISRFHLLILFFKVSELSISCNYPVACPIFLVLEMKHFRFSRTITSPAVLKILWKFVSSYIPAIALFKIQIWIFKKNLQLLQNIILSNIFDEVGRILIDLDS